MNDGDYVGPDPFLASDCNGHTDWAWTGNNSTTYEWIISGTHNTNAVKCTVWTYIPTDHGGAYAARYDIWWRDSSNNWHWLAWPGHDVDQESLSGWYPISHPLWV